MHFVPSNAGPYWMTDAEKLANRKDTSEEKKIKQFQNKGDLLVAIKRCVSKRKKRQPPNSAQTNKYTNRRGT
jgi:hypothetical protein